MNVRVSECVERTVDPVCRVCLVGDVRLLRVVDVGLRELYETLTHTQLESGAADGLPCRVCAVCLRQLQRSRAFRQRARRANSLLRHQHDPESRAELTKLSLGTVHNLVVSPTQHWSISGDREDPMSTVLVTIKEEPPEVKKEPEEIVIEHDEVSVKLETFQDVDISYDSQNTELTRLFPNNEDVKSSLRQHSDPGVYCDVCNNKFANKYNLLKHLSLHSGEKPYSCSECGKAFPHKSNLKSHMRVHAETKPYPCGRCDKAYIDKKGLMRHQLVHSGVKPYPCTLCEKAFNDKSTLAGHLRSHDGTKPFGCPTCPKAFSKKTSLTAHVRTHTGERPYACAACPRAFADRGTLRGHARTHSADRPYACAACPRAFADRSNLRKHARVHTGEKPYACRACARAYTRRVALARHRCAGAPPARGD